jgi:hypothetical protein
LNSGLIASLQSRHTADAWAIRTRTWSIVVEWLSRSDADRARLRSFADQPLLLPNGVRTVSNILQHKSNLVKLLFHSQGKNNHYIALERSRDLLRVCNLPQHAMDFDQRQFHAKIIDHNQTEQNGHPELRPIWNRETHDPNSNLLQSPDHGSDHNNAVF